MKLNYRISGTGKKNIVFIHGNSQSLFVWSKIISILALEDDLTLIALDLPGHGKSDRSNNPKNDYSIFGLSENVKQFINESIHEPYLLIGNSLGANIIGEIALSIGNCKGILINGSTALNRDSVITDLVRQNPNTATFYDPWPSEFQLDLLIEDMGYGLTLEDKERLKADFKRTDENVRTQLYSSIQHSFYTNELSNILNSSIPIATVFGEKDKFCQINFLDNYFPDKWMGKTLLIPTSGHCSQLDQPTQFSQIVIEFAKECFSQME